MKDRIGLRGEIEVAMVYPEHARASYDALARGRSQKNDWLADISRDTAWQRDHNATTTAGLATLAARLGHGTMERSIYDPPGPTDPAGSWPGNVARLTPTLMDVYDSVALEGYTRWLGPASVLGAAEVDMGGGVVWQEDNKVRLIMQVPPECLDADPAPVFNAGTMNIDTLRLRSGYRLEGAMSGVGQSRIMVAPRWHPAIDGSTVVEAILFPNLLISRLLWGAWRENATGDLHPLIVGEDIGTWSWQRNPAGAGDPGPGSPERSRRYISVTGPADASDQIIVGYLVLPAEAMNGASIAAHTLATADLASPIPKNNQYVLAVAWDLILD